MLPIILSSIAAAGIIAERLWTLRVSRVMPAHLLGQVWLWIREKKLNNQEAVVQLATQLKKRFAQSPEVAAYEKGLFNE